jgi:hypothetical protein
MKVLISILFFTVICCYSAGAQTVSSQKRTPVTQPVEPVNLQVPASTTATLVSGSRQPVISEVPVDKTQETTESKTEIISSGRKPE